MECYWQLQLHRHHLKYPLSESSLSRHYLISLKSKQIYSDIRLEPIKDVNIDEGIRFVNSLSLPFMKIEQNGA